MKNLVLILALLGQATSVAADPPAPLCYLSGGMYHYTQKPISNTCGFDLPVLSHDKMEDPMVGYSADECFFRNVSEGIAEDGSFYRIKTWTYYLQNRTTGTAHHLTRVDRFDKECTTLYKITLEKR